jgi:hypothetical protein
MMDSVQSAMCSGLPDGVTGAAYVLPPVFGMPEPEPVALWLLRHPKAVVLEIGT